MSGKLDQSLDEIVSTQRAAGGRRRSTRRRTGRIATAAPVGGVKKSTKQSTAVPTKQGPIKAAGSAGISKVVVSNLPKDVTEGQIKEYFQSSVGAVKKVEVSYGPGGASRGMATVLFNKVDGATKAFNNLNGLLVDGRPIRIEIVVGADKAAALAPPAKTLTERISQPKAQPKSAANDKKKGAAGKGAGARDRKQKRPAKNSRPTKKTAEELDSEMADYFDASAQNNENANGGAPAAPAAAPATGDAAMDDEIL